MAAMDRSDIPSGLNKIKTRRVPPEDSSGGDDSPAPAFARSAVAPSYGAASLKTSDDRRRTGAGSQRTGNSKGFRRGKKIARWFSSYLSVNDSRNMFANSPESENYKAEGKAPCKSLSNRKQFTDLKEVAAQKSTCESISVGKIENGKKSFSHELGPRGGICPSQPRFHSYDDLKELLGSFHSKCHACKEVVDAELTDFASDLVEIIDKTLFSGTKSKIEDLLLLAQNCMEMSCNEFRKKCEGTVQELMDQRLLCEEDFLRQILTRMLFILTRCTRLLQFQKDGGAINEDSLHKFRLCLDSIPVVELGWPLKSEKINKLAEIARRIEDLDFKSEGALEVSEACMRDLENILTHSRVKALIVDSFGDRLMNLLREKHLAALVHGDLSSCFDESVPSEDNLLQSENSTPQSSYKERTHIDDFEIIKPISRGAFGEVFLARKRTTGDLFAIKVLKRLHMIRKNDIGRILAERNILITVRNPFVVRFFYSFTCRDNLYLVMEYLNGGDLYSLLRKIECLEEDVARIYIAELVLALEYLHSLGIVHRDLKPDNILIARDGHIKLTDFGLSKIGLINNAVDLSGSESNSSILLDPGQSQDFSEYALKEEDKESRNSAVGTPDYLAPEILLGTKHGYAADWWSVGIILFELITGIPPFTAELPERIFENILNMKIPWPEVPDEMSYEAKDLIERLLVLEPHQRLGATGASEVKAHPFFNKVDWDNLTLQKAAFVPNPESADDTSYFLSRYSSISLRTQGDPNFSDCLSEMTELSSHQDNEITEVDQQSEWRDFPSSSSSYVDLSEINFSFKNLSQLASMNYDVLLQSGRLSKCSSPLKGPSLTSQP